jgi:hypothetical protein
MKNLTSNPNLEAQRELELEKLFSNMGSEVEMMVDLPSKGKFYNGFNGVSVSPLLFEDEQRILISKNKNSNPMNEILAKCVKGVQVADLLSFDKLFLLLKIKEISYGPEYKFQIICPNCGANVDSTLDVSKHFTINYAEDTLTDPREITLPILKTKDKVRFPRSREDDNVNDLYRFIISINDNEDPVFIAKAIKKMHIRDLKTLHKHINRFDLGIDTRFNFQCPHCEHEQVMGVPFDANFFSVN